MSDHQAAEHAPVELPERVATALSLAHNAQYDGDHHKMWVIDQMVRALTGCPIVYKIGRSPGGESYHYTVFSRSPEYDAFIMAHDGSWDEGIAP